MKKGTGSPTLKHTPTIYQVILYFSNLSHVIKEDKDYPEAREEVKTVVEQAWTHLSCRGNI